MSSLTVIHLKIMEIAQEGEGGYLHVNIINWNSNPRVLTL